MNNEELVSTPTCVHTQKLPIFPVSSLNPPNVMKDADITSLSTPGLVAKMRTATMVTSSCISNPISVLEPTSESLLVHSTGNFVSGYQTSSQANPRSGYTIGQTAPIYTSQLAACRSENADFDFEDYVDIASLGCVANFTGNPTSAHTSLTQSHFVEGPAAVYPIRDQLGEPTDTATCL